LAVIFASLIRRPHLAVSSFMMASHSSGVEGAASMPCVESLDLSSSACTMARISPLSSLTIAADVPAGASIP